MRFKNIIRLFKQGNVCVTGLRGTGKDMLMSNVIARRKEDYVSNINYGGKYHELDFINLDIRNTYRNFLDGKINRYIYPYPLRADIYGSDLGVYTPSQYCGELNKFYPTLPSFMALSRQLGECNFHINVQNLNRCWDKIREQSDIYIRCTRCIYLKGLVIQRVIIYDKYESCVDRVPPFRCPRASKEDGKATLELMKQKYRIQYGKIRARWLVYRNRSQYDTHYFRDLLAGGAQRDKDKNSFSPRV